MASGHWCFEHPLGVVTGLATIKLLQAAKKNLLFLERSLTYLLCRLDFLQINCQQRHHIQCYQPMLIFSSLTLPPKKCASDFFILPTLLQYLFCFPCMWEGQNRKRYRLVLYILSIAFYRLPIFTSFLFHTHIFTSSHHYINHLYLIMFPFSQCLIFF